MNIRILPMSDKEEWFRNKTYKQVQIEFFEKTLIEEDGKFRFGKSGIKEEPGALILFQFQGLLIACAILEDVVKYNNIIDGLRGYYKLDPTSIRTFDKISLEEFKFFCPKILQFGQAKQKIACNEIDLELLLMRINLL